MRSQNCSQESNKNTMIQKKYDFSNYPLPMYIQRTSVICSIL